MNDAAGAKIQIPIYEKDCKGEEWSAGYNAVYLLNVFKFILDAEQHNISIWVGKNHVLTISTEDLIFTISLISPQSENLVRIQRYMSGDKEPDDSEYFD